MRPPTRSRVLFGPTLAASGLLLLLLIVYNMLVHSTLADDENIGAAIRESARLHAPVAALYIFGGDQLRKLPVLHAVARAQALEIAAGIASTVRSYPPGAMDALFGMAHSPAQRHLQWTHHGAYLMLLVFGVLYWRRSREVHFIHRTNE